MTIERLAEKYASLSVEEVIEKLAETIEDRNALRAYLITRLRQNDKLFAPELPYKRYQTEEGRVRKKLNHYPGEVGDKQLLKLAKNFLLKENENYYIERRVNEDA